MNNIDIKIKDGITLHIIKTNKFKTNLLSVFLTTPLSSKNVTKNALIPAVLRRGSKNMETQEKISRTLEEMYGASFDCGIDKIGDDQILKFYLETINNNFLPDDEDNLEKAVRILLEIVFNPYTQNGIFLPEYVESEKDNLKQIIEGKNDSKALYAYERCIEEMYKDKPFGLYKYGTTKDLETINNENLYESYLNLLKDCKIDIFISGDIDEEIKEKIINDDNIKRISERTPRYIINNLQVREKEEKQEQLIEEKMNIAQGKLVIGMDILNENEEDKYKALVYNTILGGMPSSKMFQNVREKNSLAYTASSTFLRQKGNIFIKCGIESQNFEKALKIIREQIVDMTNGEFSNEIIDEAKKNIISTIRAIPEEQDTELVYYFSQELSGYKISYEEYILYIQNVNKADIIDVAKKMQINTIYFLTK